MSFSNTIIEAITPFIPLFGTSVICGVLLWGTYRVLIRRHPELGNERLFPRQLFLLGLTFMALLAVAIALPVSESSRNQIIALLGLMISGIFAFSSSTIFANLMAGIMLRITKPFGTGEFVSVGQYFGRIVERGLLDTEIQTENRELVSLPNTYMITNPISVTRISGAIVSTTLSLGYDIHHSKVESLLLEAAKESGLKEPFVQIIELGDYSITYKINGMLTDVKSLLTARSNLCRYVLDTLHGNRVEIMSPAFMNQRKLPDNLKLIPPKAKTEPAETKATAEEVVFDKAEKAEQIEKQKRHLHEKIQEYKTYLENASEENKKRIQEIINEDREELKTIKNTNVDSDSDAPEANKTSATDIKNLKND